MIIIKEGEIGQGGLRKPVSFGNNSTAVSMNSTEVVDACTRSSQRPSLVEEILAVDGFWERESFYRLTPSKSTKLHCIPLYW